MKVPVPVSVNSLASEDGSGAGSGFPPETIAVSRVLVTIGIGARQNVNVEIVEIVGRVLLHQLSHDVGGHGWRNPFSGVDALKSKFRVLKLKPCHGYHSLYCFENIWTKARVIVKQNN